MTEILFKDERCRERFPKINLRLRQICEEMAEFCSWYKRDFVITESLTTKEEDDALKRKSTSHQEGRAVDIRTRDWPEAFLQEFLNEFEKRYNPIGAITSGDNRKFLVYHDSGHGAHIHAQLDRSYTVKETK